MCGIAGFIYSDKGCSDPASHLVKMLKRIIHRGPDDSGIWVDTRQGVALGHRRLSVLDLSPAGHQPMTSACGRFVIAFNGEIYNHLKLRKELEQSNRQPGAGWRGHSDTETLLACTAAWGIEKTLQSTVGMFAFALFDRRERKFFLARDRFGEKPLYYGWHQGCLMFASELKALTAHQKFEKCINHDAVSLLITYGYIPSPITIFKNTYKMLPGALLSFHIPEEVDYLSPELCRQTEVKYWSVEQVALKGLKDPFDGTFEQAANELEEILMHAVGQQMHADVPLGAFLSGGVDSSTVVAMMQAQSNQPIKTFSIGFDSVSHNEAQHAKAVAKHLRTDHTELYVSSKEALDVIPSLALMYDEPFADSSQIPTYLVSKLAREQVTVSLSGDGGDEVFCGYEKYAFGKKLSDLPFRKVAGRALSLLPWQLLQTVGEVIPGVGPKLKVSRFKTLHGLLSCRSHVELADRISRVCKNPGVLLKDNRFVDSQISRDYGNVVKENYLLLAMTMDRQGYLTDDILVKVDRASMAVSLESRSPLLDHRIVEFASRLPMPYLYSRDGAKRVLREVLYRHVPKALIDRPKMGFSVPMADWLRGDLLEWSRDLFNQNDEILDLNACKTLMDGHLSGIANNDKILWPVLMYLQWKQNLGSM